jgi:hypothetical protein
LVTPSQPATMIVARSVAGVNDYFQHDYSQRDYFKRDYFKGRAGRQEYRKTVAGDRANGCFA